MTALWDMVRLLPDDEPKGGFDVFLNQVGLTRFCREHVPKLVYQLSEHLLNRGEVLSLLDQGTP